MEKSVENVIGYGKGILEVLENMAHLPFFMKEMRSDGSIIVIELCGMCSLAKIACLCIILESGEFCAWPKLNARGYPRTLWLPTERVHRKGYPLAQAHCTPCAQALSLCLWLTPPPFQAAMAACHPYGRFADCVGHTP